MLLTGWEGRAGGKKLRLQHAGRSIPCIWRQVGADAAQVPAAPGKRRAPRSGPGRAGLWRGPPCTCLTWGSYLWDRVVVPGMFSRRAAVERHVLCRGWHIWMSPLGGLGTPRQPGCGDSTSPARSLPFPCRNRLGKAIPWERGARQKDANGQPVAFPAQALPAAPVPPSAAALGLSPRGEGVMQRDRRGRGSACATSLELPGR